MTSRSNPVHLMHERKGDDAVTGCGVALRYRTHATELTIWAQDVTCPACLARDRTPR